MKYFIHNALYKIVDLTLIGGAVLVGSGAMRYFNNAENSLEFIVGGLAISGASYFYRKKHQPRDTNRDLQPQEPTELTMTDNERKLFFESSATQNYLGTLQDVIKRIAENSSKCKTWCVTLVSAVVVYCAENNNLDALVFGILPAILFMFLDAYYLSIERDFRDVYKKFVASPSAKGLFKMEIPEGRWVRCKTTAGSMTSFSVFPLYGLIGVGIKVVYCFMTHPAAPKG